MTGEANFLRYEEISRSVRARHLTFPLSRAVVFVEDEPQAAAFIKMTESENYDYAPLLRDGRVVGRVARERLRPSSSEPVRLASDPLDDRMVVSADATLRELIVALGINPFLFVVTAAELTGFVTVSDLNR